MTNTFLEFYFPHYDLEERRLKLAGVGANFRVVFEMLLPGARQNLRKVTEGQWGIRVDLYLNKEN